MRRPGKSKDERTRTFTGCRSCRNRHTKCDEEQPACGVCRRLGVPCGGYAPRLFWITDESTSTGSKEQSQPNRASEYRFQMFTEEERRCMSNELSSCAQSGAELDLLLAEIDAAYKENNAKCFERSVGYAKGPFSVFDGRAGTLQPASQQSVVPESSGAGSIGTVNEDIVLNDHGDEFVDEEVPPNWPDELSHSKVDGFPNPLEGFIEPPQVYTGGMTDASMLIDPALAGFDLDYDAVQSHFSSSNVGWMSPALSPILWPDAWEFAETGNQQQEKHHRRSIVPSPRASTPSREVSSIPEHAETLLRHYKQYSQNTIENVRGGRRSALHTVFLPCALETFSELMLWNTASHTRLAILPTLCAYSAFLLHRSGSGDSGASQNNWWTIGTQYLKRAQTHLQQALQHELTGPNKAPYKELLIAILGLAMTSFYTNTTVANVYLLDAERLIRLCGFEQAQLSNEARLLHHMYTHLRIFSESVTNFDKTPSIDRGSGVEALSLAKSRAFRIGEDSLNTGLDSSVEKSREQGLRDIHLESQARWSRTMYPMIYGIPESIMTLVAQTVSLANEKQRLQSMANQNPELSAALGNHIRKLEQSMWAWSLSNEFHVIGPARPPKHDGLEGDDHEGLLEHRSKHLMTMALHQALIIYFYRRVHGVNAMILQDAVVKTFHYLDSLAEDMIRDQDMVPGLAWVAFVAASEAVTIDLRERAVKFLDLIDRLGFFFTPKSTKETVARIWEMREQTGDLTIGWAAVIDDD